MKELPLGTVVAVTIPRGMFPLALTVTEKEGYNRHYTVLFDSKDMVHVPGLWPLYVYYYDNCYIPHLHRFPYLWHSQDINCVDFIENALFKCSGDIYRSLLPFLLLGELFQVCRSNSSDSSLVTVDYQLLNFLSAY